MAATGPTEAGNAARAPQATVTDDVPILGQSRAVWIAELLGLRRLTQRILAAVSTGLSAAVLSAGALRNALLSAEVLTPAQFPSHWVLLYGGLFTVVFTLVFVPSFLEWRGVAARLVDEAFPIPHDGLADETWHEGRQRMSTMLGLDASPLQALWPFLGIVSPVLISLAAIFVPELDVG